MLTFHFSDAYMCHVCQVHTIPVSHTCVLRRGPLHSSFSILLFLSLR